jgi:hypothetical protein
MSSPSERDEIVALRLIFKRNSRLNLEFLAGLSRLLREHEEIINPELLNKIVIAIPEELPGIGAERVKVEETRDAGGNDRTVPPQPIPPQPPPLLVPPQPPLLVPPQPPIALGGQTQSAGKSGKTRGGASSKKGKKGTRKR